MKSRLSSVKSNMVEGVFLRPDYIQACFSKDLYTQVDEMSLYVVEVESDILP